MLNFIKKSLILPGIFKPLNSLTKYPLTWGEYICCIAHPTRATFKSFSLVSVRILHHHAVTTSMTSSSSSQHLQSLHLQHRMHGAARSRKGEATRSSTPNPAKIPTT